MARLNEPPPSVESIDALKRRFVRQNREIARANSTQSLRIRNLESEISRLLAENIALREQCIKLQYEVDKNPSRCFVDNLGTVKGNLEAKLTELGSLVQELGKVQESDGKIETQRRSIGRASPKRSPDQKNWKNALTLSEVTGGADGRLPPIVEDKYFPRRTMDTEELLGIIAGPANTTDSPDLGPPPVAHFEEGDPIKFDPSQGSLARKVAVEAVEEVHPPLSANLETRKKRRESSQHSEVALQKVREMARTSGTAVVEGLPVTAQSLKAGAKRKLNAREDDDQTEGAKVQDKEDFRFSRRRGGITNNTGVSNNQNSSQDLVTSQELHRAKSKEPVSTSAKNGRRALGPKSVNTDPVASPAKTNKPGGNDKIAEIKDDLARRIHDRTRPKDKAPSTKNVLPPKDPQACSAAGAISGVLPPETPVPLPLDIFSSVSSEPSAARPESRDTPPPSDLNLDTSNLAVFGTAGRATRRPRGSVSYAEPNLRDKMRRPTKDLVDAVGADERPQVLGSINIEGSKSESDPATEKRTVVIKKEEGTGDDQFPSWKLLHSKKETQTEQQQRFRSEATSPLGNRPSSTADLPISVLTDRRRRTTITVHHSDNDMKEASEPDKPNPSTSGAGSAIAALVAGSTLSKAKRRDEGMERKVSKVLEGDIYDLDDSSLPDEGGNVRGRGAKETPVTAVGPTRMSSRRYSSVPAAAVDEGIGGVSAHIARRGERRRAETPEIQSSTTSSNSRAELKGARSVTGLGVGSHGREGEEAGMGRAERAAGRRRSMML